METKVVSDAADFQCSAQQLLAQCVAPEDVAWVCDAWEGDAIVPTPNRRRGSRLTGGIIPLSFLHMADLVVLHKDPDRFQLLYRLVWRMVHEPELKDHPDDADLRRAKSMAHAVRRDIARLKGSLAFVAIVDDGGPVLCAWAAPVHHVLESVAAFLCAFDGQRRVLASADKLALCQGGHCRMLPGTWTAPQDEGEWRQLLARVDFR